MREHFHVPAHYFLSHSVGCAPKRVEAALNEGFHAPWRDGRNWADWMTPLDEFRRGIGGLINAPAANVCPQVNISSALTKIIHSVPCDPARPTLLLSAQDFPTIGFVLSQAERAGYKLRYLEGDPARLETWQAALDETVAFAHITHALSNTSHLLPVREISAAARAVGARSIVDVAQSLVVSPVDVTDWQVDFLTGTSVKFLCGGPGGGFLYASDAMLCACEPIDVGWFSHTEPFEMDIHDFRYAEDAMRFYGGTPSPAPLVMANAALSIWAEIGIENVHERVQSHLTALVTAVPETARVSPSNRTRAATLVINPPNRDTFRRAADEAGLFCDERTAGFRFSVHGYTSDAEIDHLARFLCETL